MNVEIHRGALRELDQRSADGFEVTLLWSERTNAVFVCVEDNRMKRGFHFAIDGTDALDAFRHPYAYARRSRVADGGR
jgi:hypothetical protein